MIAHIVVLKLKDKSATGEIKAALDSLPAKIEQIKKYEVGIDEMDSSRSFHLSLYSQFESFDALEIYSKHPDHLDVLGLIGKHAEIVHVVDYTI